MNPIPKIRWHESSNLKTYYITQGSAHTITYKFNFSSRKSNIFSFVELSSVEDKK